jgi:hypothetical protein
MYYDIFQKIERSAGRQNRDMGNTLAPGFLVWDWCKAELGSQGLFNRLNPGPKIVRSESACIWPKKHQQMLSRVPMNNPKTEQWGLSWVRNYGLNKFPRFRKVWDPSTGALGPGGAI